MKDTFYTILTDVSVTIALIADLHNTTGEDAIKSLRRKQPDFICIAGDLVVGFRSELQKLNDETLLIYRQKNIIPFVENCVDIAPTFISLGNHEWFISDLDISALKATGAIVLDNSWIREEKNGQRFVIGGLTAACVENYKVFKKTAGGRYPIPPTDDKKSNKLPHYEWLTEFEKQEGYKVLLSHHPEYWSLKEPMLCEHPIDLVLSGHAHGGQIRLFGQGVYAPGQGFFPKCTKGMWNGKVGKMIVSAGLSNTYGLIPRLFNPIEVVYVELRK